MSHNAGALASAEAQVAAVRDDPAASLALLARLFHGPTGRAPRHLPFRRAALSFMRWQAQRGVLNPLDASPPGSVWWRAMNDARNSSQAATRSATTPATTRAGKAPQSPFWRRTGVSQARSRTRFRCAAPPPASGGSLARSVLATVRPLPSPEVKRLGLVPRTEVLRNG